MATCPGELPATPHRAPGTSESQLLSPFLCPSRLLFAPRADRFWLFAASAYFPLHEDPGAPIRRPHPFQHDATAACQRSIALTAISAPMMHPDNHYEHHSRAADAPPPPTLAQVDTSYLTPALQDQLLPQGKYYPSNYEQRHPEQALRSSRPALSPVVAAASSSSSCPSSFRSDPLARAEGAAMAAALAPEDESRRKMRQYQQDMIAQATVALGNTTKVGAKDARYGSLHKPRSPKLAPLGSPGPVTPMELEAAVGAAPGYLEHGASQEKRNREIIVAQETGLAAHST